MKRAALILMSVLWLFAATHCLIGQAFASGIKNEHFKQSHCPGHKSESSDRQSSPNNETCHKQGCCQPVLRNTAEVEDLDQPLQTLEDPAALFLAIVIVHSALLDYSEDSEGSPHHQWHLTKSLQIAANAPPLVQSLLRTE
jgi:hypothetical protein